MKIPADISLKKNEISRAADRRESEPWTQFLSVLDPHIALMLHDKLEKRLTGNSTVSSMKENG